MKCFGGGYGALCRWERRWGLHEKLSSGLSSTRRVKVAEMGHGVVTGRAKLRSEIQVFNARMSLCFLW